MTFCALSSVAAYGFVRWLRVMRLAVPTPTNKLLPNSNNAKTRRFSGHIRHSPDTIPRYPLAPIR